jgi:hypothetical protein
MRTIELPLSRNYVRDWGLKEAVRELIQNALDSHSPMQYAFHGDSLIITNRDVVLDPKTLILGNTSKADDDSKIGKFGEGYKIALLVLAREGYKVTMRNGQEDWIPSMRHSDTYGGEVLHIDMFPVDTDGTDRLEFRIPELTNTESNEIYDSCLHFQPEMDDAIQTPRGRILPDRPNKLYVRGLYVCDTELNYGYDINPEYLHLDRDRMSVSDFDLQQQTKEMWFHTQRWDDIAAMMDDQVSDLAYADFGAPELVKEACYKRFVEKNPGAVIAASHAEREKLVAKGLTVVQVSSRSYYSAVSESRSYKETVGAKIRIAPPDEWLAAWAERNQRNMSLPLRQEFKKVVAEATKWSIKR